jgi:hypothetical protein
LGIIELYQAVGYICFVLRPWNGKALLFKSLVEGLESLSFESRLQPFCGPEFYWLSMAR